MNKVNIKTTITDYTTKQKALEILNDFYKKIDLLSDRLFTNNSKQELLHIINNNIQEIKKESDKK